VPFRDPDDPAIGGTERNSAPAALRSRLAARTDVATFFTAAHLPDPRPTRITGVLCGVRVEEAEDPLMREVRYLDKLIDELARGRPMERILRTPE
jgi:hypothetical protein